MNYGRNQGLNGCGYINSVFQCLEFTKLFAKSFLQRKFKFSKYISGKEKKVYNSFKALCHFIHYDTYPSDVVFHQGLFNSLYFKDKLANDGFEQQQGKLYPYNISIFNALLY